MNGTAGRKRRDVSFDDPFTLESKLEKVRLGMAQLDRVNLDSYLSPLNTTTENLKLDEKTYKRTLEDVFPLLVILLNYYKYVDKIFMEWA